MLSALERNGNKINASQAYKDNNYYCPTCREKLILKQGIIKIPHFAHEAKSTCTWNNWEPESQRHLEIKSLVMANIKANNRCKVAEYEYPIDNYIADVYFKIKGTKYAFECQCSPKSLEEFIHKTRAYSDMDIHTVWIFNFPMKWFKGKTRLNDEVRPSAIMKESHKLYFGKIYAMYKEDLVGIHFEPVYRESEVFDADLFGDGIPYNDCWDTVQKTLKSIKEPNVRILPDWKLKPYENNGQKNPDDYYLLGKFYDKKWW